MDPALNKIVLNLAEAKVSLYPANADGSPDLTRPLWTGADAEDLKALENWLVLETRPVGAPHPVKHPLVAQYVIRIGRVWALDLAELDGFQADWPAYVLDVIWTEEEGQQWHRRIFYGVTIESRSLDSRTIAEGFTDELKLAAQSVAVSSGAPASPPPAPGLPPTLYQVFYTPPDPGLASVLLYTYDAGTHQFTAAASTAGRATIGYTAGAFAAAFAGDSPVVSTTADERQYRNAGPYRSGDPYCGTLFKVRGGIFAGAPNPGDLPRLDFYYGTQKICSLTRNGLFDASFNATEPALTAGVFGIYAGTTLAATLGAGEVDAKNFVIGPAQMDQPAWPDAAIPFTNNQTTFYHALYEAALAAHTGPWLFDESALTWGVYQVSTNAVNGGWWDTAEDHGGPNEIDTNGGDYALVADTLTPGPFNKVAVIASVTNPENGATIYYLFSPADIPTGAISAALGNGGFYFYTNLL